jgi:hypothetical protein
MTCCAAVETVGLVVEEIVGPCLEECAEKVLADVVEVVKERDAVEIVEKMIKHQSKICRLLNALVKLCCRKTTSTDSDG